MDHSTYQYKYFKATVPEKNVYVAGRGSDLRWRFYDFGPKQANPLICLGGIAATSDVFYKQIMSLGLKGYRVISVDFPPVWTHQKWITSLDQFLDNLSIYQVHLYGSSLGGFLAQLYAQHRPRRVLSLVLSNTFLDTLSFHASCHPWSAAFRWTPDVILKRLILSGIQEGPQEPLIVDAIDFLVLRIESLSQQELASRMVLNTLEGSVGSLALDSSRVTLMDCMDHSASMTDAVGLRYPKARKAFLKSGGDFPFLSRADEVNLHLLLHLRFVGAERQGPPESDDSPHLEPSRGVTTEQTAKICVVPSEDEGEERNESDGVAEAQVRIDLGKIKLGAPSGLKTVLVNQSDAEALEAVSASLSHGWEEREGKQKPVGWGDASEADVGADTQQTVLLGKQQPTVGSAEQSEDRLEVQRVDPLAELAKYRAERAREVSDKIAVQWFHL